MHKRALAILALLFASTLAAQDSGEAFGESIRRSLERSRTLFPESARPGSPLSQAILARINWLTRNDPDFFSHADWPMKVAAAEAARLGIRPAMPTAAPPAAPRSAERRYLGLVTANFSVTGASFRKGQQIVLESLQDYGKRGTTIVNGQPILLWLDNVRVLRELQPGEAAPVVVKIESARYGLPGTSGYSVSGMVQSLIAPDASGRYEILVSDALLTPGAARRLGRDAASRGTAAGRPTPAHVLTVTYTINGLEKTKQGLEGEILVLD